MKLVVLLQPQTSIVSELQVQCMRIEYILAELHCDRMEIFIWLICFQLSASNVGVDSLVLGFHSLLPVLVIESREQLVSPVPHLADYVALGLCVHSIDRHIHKSPV